MKDDLTLLDDMSDGRVTHLVDDMLPSRSVEDEAIAKLPDLQGAIVLLPPYSVSSVQSARDEGLLHRHPKEDAPEVHRHRHRQAERVRVKVRPERHGDAAVDELPCGGRWRKVQK